MRATDPLQDLLYFVCDPWPWGKPPMLPDVAGMKHIEGQRNQVQIEIVPMNRHDLALIGSTHCLGVDPIGRDGPLCPHDHNRLGGVERARDLGARLACVIYQVQSRR